MGIFRCDAGQAVKVRSTTSSVLRQGYRLWRWCRSSGWTCIGFFEEEAQFTLCAQREQCVYHITGMHRDLGGGWELSKEKRVSKNGGVIFRYEDWIDNDFNDLVVRFRCVSRTESSGDNAPEFSTSPPSDSPELANTEAST